MYLLFCFSGPHSNKPCVFPFKYGGVTHYGCVSYGFQVLIVINSLQFNLFTVQPWCSTIYIDDGYNWGHCGPDCAMHEDTMTWRKDETVKMSLQYSNTALWVGLELYGSILPWIFLLGLVLATLPPILGKV